VFASGELNSGELNSCTEVGVRGTNVGVRGDEVFNFSMAGKLKLFLSAQGECRHLYSLRVNFGIC